MAYLFEIGGGYFEYRPMDFYWPLLAIPAAEGLARVGAGLSGWLHQLSRHLRWAGCRLLTIVLFVPLLFYAGAIQAALLFEIKEVPTPEGVAPPLVVLDESNAGWLQAAPGMPALVAVSNDLRSQGEPQKVGERVHRHDDFAVRRLRRFEPYEAADRGAIPGDAVMAMDAVGIIPYYLPDITFIDILGLTDATVARTPVTHPSSERELAHDRRPPPGYLPRRGLSIRVGKAEPTEAKALSRANYAVQIGPGVWMPFEAYDHAWANDRFGHLDLRANNRFSQDDPAGNRVIKDGVFYVGEEFLGRFEDRGLDGWQRESKAVTNHILGPFYDRVYPVEGHVGPGFLTTYYPGKWERTGRATSPTFTARDDQFLMFLIAGERHDFVGLRLLADGEEVADWRGDSWHYFNLVIFPLRELAGKELQLEIFNNEIGDRPRLMLDHVMLVREESSGSRRSSI